MMAVVTSVKWYLIVVLIGIDLILIDVEFLSCAFIILYLVSISYLLKLASWNLALFGILFW